jgi:hypothetical protein
MTTRYPIVTQLPVDEAYRAPHMLNTQYQALVSAYVDLPTTTILWPRVHVSDHVTTCCACY